MRKVSAFRVFKQTAKDGTKKFRVRFFNPDGSIIKTVNLRAGSRIAAYNEARELTEKGEGLARVTYTGFCGQGRMQ